jgi:hypothetical protein
MTGSRDYRHKNIHVHHTHTHTHVHYLLGRQRLIVGMPYSHTQHFTLTRTDVVNNLLRRQRLIIEVKALRSKCEERWQGRHYLECAFVGGFGGASDAVYAAHELCGAGSSVVGIHFGVLCVVQIV